MIICAQCRREMKCIRNGVIATWHKSHRYSGDLYECQQCLAQTLSTNTTPYHSTAKIDPKYQLVMEE